MPIRYCAIPFYVLAIALCGSLSTRAQKLEIRLGQLGPIQSETKTIQFQEAFEVVVENVSDAVVTIPAPSSKDGAKALSLVIYDPATKTQHQIFMNRSKTEHVQAKTIEIPPHSEYSTTVNLMADRWRPKFWSDLPCINSNSDLSIYANYAISEKKEGLWQGVVRSESTQFDLRFKRAETPQSYLVHGFPEAAMWLLIGDVNQVHRKDDELMTPLHCASQFGHVDTIKWLLENGANANAVAYNKFTPLGLAKKSARPEVYRLLLNANADPFQVDVSGESPLQEVITELFYWERRGNEANVRKWSEIFQVFLDSGVKLDLISAIQLKKRELVKKMLEQNPSLMASYQHNQAALRAAVKSGQSDLARFLIENFPEQIDVNNFRGNSMGRPVILDALSDLESVKLLIEKGADLKGRIRRVGFHGPRIIWDNATILHYAARDAKPEVVQHLLDCGLSPFEFPTDGKSQNSIQISVEFVRADVLETFLKHESFQKASQGEKNAILQNSLATVCNFQGTQEKVFARPSIVQVLLKNGADATSADGKRTFIQMVSSRVHPTLSLEEAQRMANRLQLAGGELDFFSAVALNNVGAIDEMLAQDPQLSHSRRPDGYPAAHFAVSRGDLDLVKKLLVAGCDIDLRHERLENGRGSRMLHVALKWRRGAIAEYLIACGANVNVVDRLGTTPLHLAAKLNSLKMVEIFVKEGADVFATDNEGRTPLDVCTNPQVKKLLGDAMGND